MVFIQAKKYFIYLITSSSLIAKQKLVKGFGLPWAHRISLPLPGYTGFDPEVGSYVGANANANNQAIGLDYGRYPLTPIYTFNLRCKLLKTEDEKQ